MHMSKHRKIEPTARLSGAKCVTTGVGGAAMVAAGLSLAITPDKPASRPPAVQLVAFESLFGGDFDPAVVSTTITNYGSLFGTDLPDFTQGQVRDGIGARNLEDARNIVARLQSSAACATATATPSPSASASRSGTATKQPSRTPSPSGTKKPTATRSATRSASPTTTPSGSPSPTGTATPSPDDCDTTP
jgi:hypothetical protein